MSNEIKFRIFEMLATHDDELTLNHVLCDLEKSYDILYVADIIIDMVENNQIKYFSFYAKTYRCPTRNFDMCIYDRICYYDD